MKVLILTEGGRDIGFGHITRCISLCQAFEEESVVPELVVNGDDLTHKLLERTNHQVFDWSNEQQVVFEMVKDADVVFIDSYLADRDFYENISARVERAVYFDDNVRMKYPRGWVVNGAAFAEQMPYPKRTEVTYLLGTKYTPLRKEFWDIPARQARSNIEIVMVTFGGTDMHNVTPKVLKFLNATFPESLRKIIVGVGFSNIREIEKLRDRNTELIYCPDAAGIEKVMIESDIAISACGQTLYELARVGVPTIGICIAENQSQNIAGWIKQEFLEYIGWHNDENLTSNLEASVNLLANKQVREHKSNIGREAIDGQGVRRICELLL